MILSVVITPAEAFIRGWTVAACKMTNDDGDTMKDVSHTAPHDTSAKAVWERGRRPIEEDEE